METTTVYWVLEGMGKNIENTTAGSIGTAIRVHSFIPNVTRHFFSSVGSAQAWCVHSRAGLAERRVGLQPGEWKRAELAWAQWHKGFVS